MSPITIRLDAQFGTPYPRSTGFDTDSDELATAATAGVKSIDGGGDQRQEAGDTMFTQVRALLMEVKPYVLLDLY